MRRLLAALALLVTTWSNAAAFPCGSPAGSVADAHGDGAHSHTGHGSDHGSQGHPEQQDGVGKCGILMACGALSRGPAAMGTEAILPPRLDDAPVAALPEPSTADLTQDPPPPRRLA